MFLSNRLHYTIYFWSIVIFAMAINWSPWMMGFMVGVLLLVWLLQPSLANGIANAAKRPSIFLFSALFFIAVIWLAGTQNMPKGIDYLVKTVPVFILPLVFGSSPRLRERDFEWVIIAYVFSTVVSSMFNLGYFMATSSQASDVREMSFFMSHIRYSLFIVLAISFSFYFIYSKKSLEPFKRNVLYFSLVWLIIFLFLLQSVTGIAVFFFLLFILLFVLLKKTKNIIYRLSIIGVFATSISYITWLIFSGLHNFYPIKQVDISKLDTKTAYGNTYSHTIVSPMVENGRYVFLYICDAEVWKAWSERSRYPYDSLDRRGQFLPQTIIRYLTSKDLRKDRDGIYSLTEQDVKNIESGITNYKLSDKFSLQGRIYQIMWELDMYFKGQNPSGHSITQRFEFIKCAIAIIESNQLLGIGTGDLKDEMKAGYDKINSQLNNRDFLPHSQFFTIIIRFGFVGLTLFFLSIASAVLIEKRQHDFLVLVHLFIVIVSMVNEDTLETQYGIILFAFWGALLLLARQQPDRQDETTKIE